MSREESCGQVTSVSFDIWPVAKDAAFGGVRNESLRAAEGGEGGGKSSVSLFLSGNEFEETGLPFTLAHILTLGQAHVDLECSYEPIASANTAFQRLGCG